jgi:hypothetical protein
MIGRKRVPPARLPALLLAGLAVANLWRLAAGVRHAPTLQEYAGTGRTRVALAAALLFMLWFGVLAWGAWWRWQKIGRIAALTLLLYTLTVLWLFPPGVLRLFLLLTIACAITWQLNRPPPGGPVTTATLAG